jgi:ATP-dependent Clp protease ATP-binding subunit ClpB
MFHRLGRAHMSQIVDIQLARLQKLLENRHITLNITSEAKTWLGDQGYEPAYGARPLKRVIQRNVQDLLADRLLKGELNDGDQVTLDCIQGKISLIASLS